MFSLCSFSVAKFDGMAAHLFATTLLMIAAERHGDHMTGESAEATPMERSQTRFRPSADASDNARANRRLFPGEIPQTFSLAPLRHKAVGPASLPCMQPGF